MNVLSRLIPAWVGSPPKAATPQQTCRRQARVPDALQPTPAKLSAPVVSYALAKPVKSCVVLHGARPATSAFKAATRAAYAPPVLRRIGHVLHAAPGPAREIRIFGSDGEVLFAFDGCATGQGATCNFYPARKRDGSFVGLLEYRIGMSVICAGPQARALIDVDSLQRQARVTRLACPALEMSEPAIVDDLVYMSAKLMDASVRNIVRQRANRARVSTADHLALVRCCMRQVLRALDYAASVGVHHRDIKPDNILVNADGAFLMTDWGQAYAQSEADNLLMGGTAGYAPPEHTRAGSVDVRGDMFSLGVTLAELLGADVRDLPASHVDKHTGTCGGLEPSALLGSWFDSRTNAQGAVRWNVVAERADDRCEELLLRNIDRFALDALRGGEELTNYLFAHLLRFDASRRHTPSTMLAWIDARWPDEATDIAASKRVLPRLLGKVAAS